jgi:hypothetical protein
VIKLKVLSAVPLALYAAIQKMNSWFWWFSEFPTKRLYSIHIHFDLRISDFVLDLPEVGIFLSDSASSCTQCVLEALVQELNANLTIQYSLLAQSWSG